MEEVKEYEGMIKLLVEKAKEVALNVQIEENEGNGENKSNLKKTINVKTPRTITDFTLTPVERLLLVLAANEEIPKLQKKIKRKTSSDDIFDEEPTEWYMTYPFLIGVSSSDKSMTVNILADMIGLKETFYTVNLSAEEREDIMGYPKVDDKTGKVKYLLPIWTEKKIVLFDGIDKVYKEQKWNVMLEFLSSRKLHGEKINCLLIFAGQTNMFDYFPTTAKEWQEEKINNGRENKDLAWLSRTLPIMLSSKQTSEADIQIAIEELPNVMKQIKEIVDSSEDNSKINEDFLKNVQANLPDVLSKMSYKYYKLEEEQFAKIRDVYTVVGIYNPRMNEFFNWFLLLLKEWHVPIEKASKITQEIFFFYPDNFIAKALQAVYREMIENKKNA